MDFLDTQRLMDRERQIRAAAPTLSVYADRIRDNLNRPTSVDWFAIIRLVQGLLGLYLQTCGQGQTPEEAAKWLNERPAFGFRRMRLRRAIRQNAPPELGYHMPHLIAALENSCDTIPPGDFASLSVEAKELPVEATEL